jgi:hypothetical protein
MAQNYGIVAQPPEGPVPELPPARFLVLIDSASHGTRLARLFLASHEAVAEFDAGAPEVQMMTRGLMASRSADRGDWDTALAGHTAAERARAEVYTLDV